MDLQKWIFPVFEKCEITNLFPQTYLSPKFNLLTSDLQLHVLAQYAFHYKL